MPVEHFKSKEAYRKNLAYRHIHDIPFTATSVDVGGKSHEVKHSKDPQRMAIDSQQRRKAMKKEEGETPEMEVKSHTSGFLKKAAHMADKKFGGRKSPKVAHKRHAHKKSA